MVTLTSLSLGAQTLYWGGEVISPANMSHMEAAKYAQTDNNYLSARVAAMGGAFTSLGADLSSMTINPAGLGMYRTSHMSISSNFDHTRSVNNTVGFDANKSNFSFNQLGAALNVYQGTGSLLSFTVGFAYNKLADLNYTNAAEWSNGAVTIGEFFAEQMYGVNPADLGSSKAPFTNPNIYTDQWGGVLAYRTYLIDPNIQNDTFMGDYYVGSIPVENLVNTGMVMKSRGRVEEYDFSMGLNFGNILYLGTTLGIVGIEQFIDYSFFEEYVGAQGEEMKNMEFSPSVSNYGSGLNFKIGAILRPVSAVRLGVAYHTGTSVSLTRDYSAQMITKFMNGDGFKADSYINSYTYNYSSPSKLLLGASVSLADKAILSVDCDKVWYGGMSMYMRDLEEAFENDVKADLGTANNFRVGVEVRPTANLYVRGGYGYYGSPLNDEAARYNNEGGAFYGTYKTHSDNFSLGLGWRFASGSSLDFVWTTSRAHYTNSVMYDYYYESSDKVHQIFVTGPTLTGVTHTSNSFGLTYSVLLF